jgi:hypothetical protein
LLYKKMMHIHEHFVILYEYQIPLYLTVYFTMTVLVIQSSLNSKHLLPHSFCTSGTQPHLSWTVLPLRSFVTAQWGAGGGAG